MLILNLMFFHAIWVIWANLAVVFFSYFNKFSLKFLIFPPLSFMGYGKKGFTFGNLSWEWSWWWWWIVFLVWLTGERRLALFAAGTFVRDLHYRESLTRCGQGLNLRRTFRHSWMKLYSSDNHYPRLAPGCCLSKWGVQLLAFMCL